MNTIRSCFTATVAFLVVTIRIAESRLAWKCCPWDRMYDPEVRFCRPAGADVVEYQQRLLERLDRVFRVAANAVFDISYYERRYCFPTDVLVDVPAVEVSGLMEAHPSPIKLPRGYCFDLTPSDELVARTCRPRDQYCGQGNYTCVNKCCDARGYIFVDDPNHKLTGTDVDEYEQRLLKRLQRGFRLEANERLRMYHYEPPFCNATEVLVDVPAEEVSGLMEAHPSPIELLPGYCFDLTPSDELVAQTCRPRDQYCGRVGYTCVKKCCGANHMYVKHRNNKRLMECKDGGMPFTLSAYETGADGSPAGRSNNTVLPYWDGQELHKAQTIESSFMLTTDGKLHLLDGSDDEWIIPNTEYCIEYYAGDGPPEAADLLAFVYPNAKRPVNYIFWVTYSPSVVCLVLTLIVYATLPYLRNAHGHYVMFYMACQLVDFVFIMIYYLVYIDTKSPLCIPYGYFFLFAILTTCCWLNVICFDIYWNLRYNNSTIRNTPKSVRSIMYHIYCWGFSSICVSTSYLFQHSQNETLRELALDIGKFDCDIYEPYHYGTIIFFWIPICGMLTANLILFLLTAIHCSRIKSELDKFRQTDSKTEIFLVYKERFVMSIKLFLVFGIPLFLTMLCGLFQIEGIIKTIITRVYYSQGVFIFIIFVAKRKVIMDLRNKFRRSTVHSVDTTCLNNISGSS